MKKKKKTGGHLHHSIILLELGPQKFILPQEVLFLSNPSDLLTHRMFVTSRNLENMAEK